MNCPICKEFSARVVDSRENSSRTIIRRRRVCEGCEFRFTTLESYIPREAKRRVSLKSRIMKIIDALNDLELQSPYETPDDTDF